MSPWCGDEVAILRKFYPHLDGVNLCRKELPGRSRAAIHNKAKILSLNTQRNYWLRRKYNFSEMEDALIREEYAKNSSNAVLKVLALKLDVNREVVSRRASELGLTLSRVKPSDWSEVELKVLQDNDYKSPKSIQKALASAGSRRTESAIANALKRFDCDRIAYDEWSPYQLSKLFGVSPNTVDRWIQKEGLAYKIMPTNRGEGRGDARLVDRKTLKKWIATHAQCVDLRKVDRFWFIDLVCGA